MPSGLTYKIYNGSDMSLRGFALKCVTQLGAGYNATNQGDKEMPLYEAPVIPVSDYHVKKLDEAKKEILHWIEVEKNPEELDKLYNEYLQKRESDNTKYNKGKTELRARYLTMISKVEAWKLPEKYQSLKELMLKQLNESMDWDCRLVSLYKEESPTKEEFLKSHISCAARDIQYHTEEYEKEIKHIKELNDYLKGLYDEINKIEPISEQVGKNLKEVESSIKKSKKILDVD